MSYSPCQHVKRDKRSMYTLVMIEHFKYKCCSFCSDYRAARRPGRCRRECRPAHDNRRVFCPVHAPAVDDPGGVGRLPAVGACDKLYTGCMWCRVYIWRMHRHGARLESVLDMGWLCPVPLPFWLSNMALLNSSF